MSSVKMRHSRRSFHYVPIFQDFFLSTTPQDFPKNICQRQDIGEGHRLKMEEGHLLSCRSGCLKKEEEFSEEI